MSRQLWIFRVSGGEPFKVRVRGNPMMTHDGSAEALLRAMCTQEEADILVAEMKTHGCTVTANCPSETAAQTTERKNIMQVLGGQRNFPSQRCPECTWFDPHLESLCGAGLAFGKPGWDDDAVEGSMSSEKFRKDFAACPLREEQTQ